MANKRGYFGIGIINGKAEVNLGTLWRSANIMGAQFIFTIGRRYPKRQSSDTMNTPNHIPLFEYDTWDDFIVNTPRGCDVVAIELDDKSKPIETFKHPEQAVYLLGAEDYGISQDVLKDCDRIVQLPGDHCLNVSVTGSIVMYDRNLKQFSKTKS